MSRFLLLLLLAACACDKGSSSTPDTPKPPPPAAPVDAAALSRIDQGGKLYQTYCALCHGPAGKGYVADHAPDLVNPTFLASANISFLRASIVLGRPGTSMAGYGKDKGGPLDDDQVGKIIEWLHAQDTVAQAPPDVGRPGNADHGKALYATNCEKCHGNDKERGPEIWLANQIFIQLASDPFLRYAIVNGRPGTDMAAWNDKLSTTDVDDLVAYVRTFASNAPTPAMPPPTNVDPLPPEGKIILNPKGKAPDFASVMKEDRFVPAADVKKALDEKKRIVIVDARPPSDWISMHIPGAVSIPYYDFSRIADLPKDGTWILTYCACPHHASGIVLDELRKQGFTNTAIIDEGILFWAQQGYPIEGKDPPQIAPMEPPK
jgi:mono/diheme cytochrome c family protein/rhodanese-related sulfurtransferase